MTDRDELLRRIDLATLLDELSPSPAVRLGPNARWRCIDTQHDDQHPSVTMFTDQRGIQRWKCWSGGHGGTAIDAILAARGGTVGEAIAALEQRAGLVRMDPVPVRPAAVAALRPTTVDPALLDYVAACERILWRPAGKAVRDYLIEQRRLHPDVLRANHVGADPGPAMLRRAPGLPRGGPAAVLASLDPNGNVVYAQARYLEPAEGRSKYDNPAGRIATNPKLGWVSPARVTDQERLFVCEGIIDALTAAGEGVAAVAVLGATYTDRQVATAIAERAGERELVVAFDGDPAGRAATERLIGELRGSVGSVRSLVLGEGEDVNDSLNRAPSESQGQYSVSLRAWAEHVGRW